jgi:DNA end-binding protein Ku
MCPIGYTKVCRNTGEVVPPEDIVRGYQYKKGDYVVLDENDFKKVDVEKTYSIDIEDFVAEKDVDIIYADKPYYLEPEKESKKVYALFRDALGEAKKAGIGKFVLKEREHVVMLRSQGNLILLNMLRFADEIVDPSELDLPSKIKIPRNQIELALELINKMSGKFHPEKYRDEYTDKLKEIVEAKKKGKKMPVKEFHKPRKTATPDIVSRLKESLAAAGR